MAKVEDKRKQEKDKNYKYLCHLVKLSVRIMFVCKTDLDYIQSTEIASKNVSPLSIQ